MLTEAQRAAVKYASQHGSFRREHRLSLQQLLRDNEELTAATMRIRVPNETFTQAVVRVINERDTYAKRLAEINMANSAP